MFTQNIQKVFSNEITRSQKTQDFRNLKYLTICLKHLCYLRSTTFDFFIDQITILTQPISINKNHISTPLFQILHT